MKKKLTELEKLQFRLNYICELLDDTFYQYNTNEDCYEVMSKFKDDAVNIGEMMMVASMQDIRYE